MYHFLTKTEMLKFDKKLFDFLRKMSVIEKFNFNLISKG